MTFVNDAFVRTFGWTLGELTGGVPYTPESEREITIRNVMRMVRDGLTGIPNRRRFDQVLGDEWKRSKRYGHNISLIMIDIDFFKRFNDHFGHTEGDACLKMVGYAKSLHRAEDLVARYGGEEFACIIPESTHVGVLAVANRIMENVRRLDIPHAQSDIADHVTVSVGVATCIPAAEDESLDLVATADRALYQAKEGGRNRIVSLDSIYIDFGLSF